MYIDKDLCQSCLDCLPVCPMGAIMLKDKEVIIDYEMCVECGVCRRFRICPEDAIKQVEEIPYPRIIRAVFSDPLVTHESTGIGGRGTEEMKTNDVTNNFTLGKIGFSVELGRPGVGAYLSDLDKVARKVTSMGVIFAEENPVIPLIADRKTGALRPEILKEKVLSAIVEFLVPEEDALDFIDELKKFMNEELETVATMSVISRADQNGDSEFLKKLKDHGETPYPNGKVNIGMAIV
ncbi:MAG: 4Fe-4S binding protein [Deltaproteobacteria bacterium]|nr:4Fe-4S binding protein [Deltaproteobacteria bacterium]